MEADEKVREDAGKSCSITWTDRVLSGRSG